MVSQCWFCCYDRWSGDCMFLYRTVSRQFYLRPCSHLFRFAFRSRSSPVPLVRVAFTPGKIDWNGSGFGPVTRSHLFRNATGTSSPVNTPHPPPAHQVFRLDVKVITCALIQHGCLPCRVLLRVYLDKQSSANS